ncbi:cytochrome P450 [Mycena epipterygia]|nr:cytochrome P450 [Mycena epipterygia]
MDSHMLQLAFLLTTAALIVFLAFFQHRTTQNAKTPSNSLLIPRSTSITYPILGSLQYFSHHWDFLRAATKNGTISYHLANQKCIAVGMENRHEFFNDSRISFALAYAVMLGATPSMNKEFLNAMGFDVTLGGRSNKFLFALLRKERINANISSLYSYAEQGVSNLGATTNPFETIYAIIFRLTVNTLGSSSVAASPAICSALAKIFHEFDRSGTPFMILFPWFLGWERIRRFYLMKQFYNIMSAALDERGKEGRNNDDPMQYFIDAGLSSMEITQFTLAALFAGIANTGIVAAYIICDLATHPEYLAQVREELDGFVSSFNEDDSLPLSTRVQSIPYEDWTASGNLPILDRCLKETLRLRLATPLHRLNDSGKDLEMGGMLVPKEAILTFHSSFIHHSEEIYTEPLKWDPERFSDERQEDKSAPMAYCGWGLGQHQCCGQKFAKFEIFLLTALIVSSYDIETAHKDGRPMTGMPPVDLNSTVISPPSEEVHFKLSARC